MLASEFDRVLTEVMHKLNVSLNEASQGVTNHVRQKNSELVRQMLILNAKQSLLDLCNSKTVDFVNVVSALQEKEEARFIFDAIASLLDNLNFYQSQICGKQAASLQYIMDLYEVHLDQEQHSEEHAQLKTELNTLKTDNDLKDLRIRELELKL